jgi:uncharacterized membrane protein
LTVEQRRARQRWQERRNLSILVAAVVPLFVTSPRTQWVQVLVGVGSWLVFLVDLVVLQRIIPDYLRRREGRVDLAIVVLTFPYYLIPGISGSAAILLLARLARVVRVVARHRRLAALRRTPREGRDRRRPRSPARVPCGLPSGAQNQS